jgi:hypothetical protein
MDLQKKPTQTPMYTNAYSHFMKMLKYDCIKKGENFGKKED